MTGRIVMTENATNAKSEALELHELSSEELDAVSGGYSARMAWVRMTEQALQML
jgi:ABC-type uncharacterized transport system YnjBCD ATPase subunit